MIQCDLGCGRPGRACASLGTITGMAAPGITKSMALIISCRKPHRRSDETGRGIRSSSRRIFFPHPLTWTWSTTKGADLMWVPIPFEKSFRMAYTRTRYGTGYYIFHQFVRGRKSLAADQAWDARAPPDQGGTGSPPTLRNRPCPQKLPFRSAEQGGRAERNATVTVARLTSATPALIRALELSVPRPIRRSPSRGRSIRITWDQPRASVHRNTGRALFRHRHVLQSGRARIPRKSISGPCEIRRRSRPDGVLFSDAFFPEAKIELISDGHTEFSHIDWVVRHEPFPDPPHQVGYFHATIVIIPSRSWARTWSSWETRRTEARP